MITLYDIPSKLPGMAWSPNTWKARYALNFKGLPYKTEWIEYPEIAPLCTKLGIPPQANPPPGFPNPFYTLPAIHDPSTGAYISDSFHIALYLDKTYPDTPRLIPEGAEGLLAAFIKAHQNSLTPIWTLILPAILPHMRPGSESYFRMTREAFFGGAKLEDVVPRGAAHTEAWANVEKGFAAFDGWYALTDKDGPFLMGSKISFADFVVVSFTVWIRRIYGETSVEWTLVKGWHNGRWVKLAEAVQKYEALN